MQASFLEESLRDENGFLLHGRGRVADGQAFVQILSKEREDAAATFILAGVDEFMGDESAVICKIAAEINAVTQREARGEGTDQPGRLSRGAQGRMIRRRNRRDSQETDGFGMGDTHPARVGKLGRRESN